MSKRSHRSWALALVLSQAVWILSGAQPASAQQVTLPENLISQDVPHDVPAGGPCATAPLAPACIQELAIFAWQEFIALNWLALDPAGPSGKRGRPAPFTDPDTGFLDIAPDTSGNFPLVVWQTFLHKNELFPYNGKALTTYDTKAPAYSYQYPVTAAVGGQIPSFNLFNNLDETSQIGLANMYAHSTNIQPVPGLPPILVPGTGIRLGYEAKANRAVFDFLNKNGLLSPNNKYGALQAAIDNTQGNLAQFGGICTFPSGVTPQPIVMLPCGDNTVAGDAGEGAIEIKAAWRKLTSDEMSSGRFFTRNVIFYTGGQGHQSYHNEVWGLVALHIIHKTKTFPAFVFATWEQVDNYDDDAAPSEYPNPENLTFQNLPIDNGTTPDDIPVRRVHPLHSQIPPVNDAVHAAFKAGNPNTIWQYYKLIGVQATPVNGPPAATASTDDLSYYFLANIVVETNQTLQSFFGQGADGVPKPFQNVWVNGNVVQMGGCQGCHGFQGQFQGGDMSRLISAAPGNSWKAESLDASATTSIQTFFNRSRHVSVPKGSLPKGVTPRHFRRGTPAPPTP